jgi:hypothetical protein
MKYGSVALKIAAAAGALFSTAALASVSLTVVDNSVNGYIDRNDVQSAFGFSDATMQRYATSVIFNYSDNLSVTYTCGTSAYVQNLTRSGTLDDSYDGSTAKTAVNAIGSGWSVTGTLRLSGGPGLRSVPQIGDSCPSGGSQPVTSVDVVESAPTLTASIPSKGKVWLDSSGIIVQ